MPTVPRAAAIAEMTAAVTADETDPALLYEISRDFLPTETTPGETRGATAERLALYLNSELSPDLVAEFWRLVHIKRHRNVWYNEADDLIYYTPTAELDPAGVD